MLLALFGYAIGTLQILLIEWVRERRQHARSLRAIRAELKRAAAFRVKCAWDVQNGPTEDVVPRPPSLRSRFIDLVSQTDFRLTDEHEDDNSQEALLGIVDGCDGLKHYATRIQAGLDKLRDGVEVNSAKILRSDMLDMAAAYDRELDKVSFVIDDTVRDIDRRLRSAGIWRQLNRPVGRLPTGTNPPPLVDGDPCIGRKRAA